ncbi:MAG: hypothetical protein Kow00123_17710 [Anaerolineales bacterium]
MIAMSDTLRAAVKASGHVPFARLSIRDRQLRWSAVHGDGAESQRQTALAVASGGAWVRARLGEGGAFQVQRLADPADPDAWEQWDTLLASGAVHDVAVSAEGNLARAFCIVAESGVWRVKVWTSDDGGGSWGGPAVAAESSSAITSLASPAPDAVAWTAGGMLRLSLWDGAAWGEVAAWSAGAVQADYGIACARRDGVYRFLQAGLLAEGAYLRAVSWDGNGWSEGHVVVPTGLPADTLIPRWPSLAWVGDRYLAAYLDTFAGSLTYQTPTVRFSWDFEHWSYPCALNLNSDGPTRANVALDTDRAVAAMENSALAAPLGRGLEGFAGILRAERVEAEGYGSLRLLLRGDEALDCAPLLPYAEAVLALGYRTAVGYESVETAPMYVTAVHRARGESRPGAEVIVHARDGWGLLAQGQALTTEAWEGVSLGWMLAEALMRAAGLRLLTDGAPVWQTTLERFAIPRGTRGDAVVRQLLRHAGARARWDADGSLYAFLPTAQPWGVDWAFDAEVLRARHGVAAAGVTLARVAGQYPALGQAQDVRAAQQQGRTLGAVMDDGYLTTSAQCAEAAAALVARGTVHALRGMLTTAIVPGLQALDRVTVDDPTLGLAAVERRVVSVRTVCDALRGVWQQTVEVEGLA